MTRASTLDDHDHRHFATLAGDWWNRAGPLKGLHHLNPERLAWLLEAAAGQFGAKNSRAPLTGLNLLDVGCGGGIFAESLARAGATVTAIDTGHEAIAVATEHAKASGLKIDYRVAMVEDEAEGAARYDIVTASEVIEHVADPRLFVASCAKLLKPNGLILFTTLNRTFKSFALAIVAAEHLLNLAPKGTHDWRKFLKPSELNELLKAEGLTLGGLMGLRYHPLAGRFSRTPHDLGINYMAWAVKAPR